MYKKVSGGRAANLLAQPMPVLSQLPDGISVWTAASLDNLRRATTPSEAGDGELDAYKALAQTIDTLGLKSQRAQEINEPLTTVSRMHESASYKLFLLTHEHRGMGILKIGVKKLFLTHPRTMQLVEVDPVCVLDFYVDEASQRKGFGKQLFAHMLKTEGIAAPAELAIDRPSDKFLHFLRRHYNLADVVPQVNNFVVFTRFFEDTHVTERGKLIRRLSAPAGGGARAQQSSKKDDPGAQLSDNGRRAPGDIISGDVPMFRPAKRFSTSTTVADAAGVSVAGVDGGTLDEDDDDDDDDNDNESGSAGAGGGAPYVVDDCVSIHNSISNRSGSIVGAAAVAASGGAGSWSYVHDLESAQSGHSACGARQNRRGRGGIAPHHPVTAPPQLVPFAVHTNTNNNNSSSHSRLNANPGGRRKTSGGGAHSPSSLWERPSGGGAAGGAFGTMHDMPSFLDNDVSPSQSQQPSYGANSLFGNGAGYSTGYGDSSGDAAGPTVSAAAAAAGGGGGLRRLRGSTLDGNFAAKDASTVEVPLSPHRVFQQQQQQQAVGGGGGGGGSTAATPPGRSLHRNARSRVTYNIITGEPE